MCGPVVPWDWLAIDLAYVLVLLGGAMLFRARRVSPATWTAFGLTAALVGALLLYGTFDAQAAFQQQPQGGVSFLTRDGLDC